LHHPSSGDLDLGTVPFAEQDVHRGTLQIHGVQELDSGEYTCVASNIAGSTSAVVILQVGGENKTSAALHAYTI